MTRFRNKTLRVMVTEEEKAEIINKMNSIGMNNIGEFVRLMLKYGSVYKIDANILNDLNYEINRIGNNINQIAKKANQTGIVYHKDLEEINGKLSYLVNFVENLYDKSGKTNGGV